MSPDSFDIPDIPDADAAGGGAGGGNGGRRGRRWPWLVAGLLAGVLGALLLPRAMGPYLPDSLRSDRLRVAGEVLKKRAEEDRLLLTVQSDSGAMLATFRRRIASIDLLVEPGDSVTLSMDEYRPFVEEPGLHGVRKAGGRAVRVPAGAGDEGGAGDTGRATTGTAPAGAGEPGGAEGSGGGDRAGDADTAVDTAGGGAR